MRYLTLALLLITACKAPSTDSATTKRLAPVPEPEPTATPSDACLAYREELECDSRLIYNADLDRFMIRCRPQDVDTVADQLQVIQDAITDKTVTVDGTIDLSAEEDMTLALHVRAAYETDVLLAFDSVNGTTPENLNPDRAGESDDTLVHWGTAPYIVGKPDVLADLMGFDNAECQP